MSRRDLRLQTAALAAAAFGVVAIAVPAFHSVWQPKAQEEAALEFNLDQVRLQVDQARAGRQQHQWNVALVASELGVNEGVAADMFKDKSEQRVLLLAAEASRGSDRGERNDARAQLAMKPESRQDDDDDAPETTSLSLMASPGWKALALWKPVIDAPSPATGRTGGRRAQMLRGIQAVARIKPAPVIVPVAPVAMPGV